MDDSTESLNFDVDSMLNHVGGFGPYQYLLLFLFSFINIISAFHYFGQIFINLIPDHQCQALNSTVLNVTSCTEIIRANGTTIEQSCSNGWTYQNDHGYVSIVQQLNWVCKDDWIPTFGQSVFFAGSVTGSLIFGVIADHIGRLHVLVIANMFALLGNTLTIASTNAFVFIFSRFIAGCATDANFVMMYIIVMEYMKPSMRTFGLNLCIGVFYCLACVCVPWIAAGLKTWRIFLITVALPHLFVLTFYCLVPESAQWLISKRKIDKAVQCFVRIAKINGRILSTKVIENLKSYSDRHIAKAPIKDENLLGLLKTPKLRKKTLILTFKSMVMTLCYDAISRNVNGLGYSPFFIFSMTSTTIFPACLVILMVQDKVGRKALASFSLFLCGMLMACSGLMLATVKSPNPALIVTLAVVARLTINVGYNSGAQYAVELIPTVVRGQGVSAIHVAGYAASFFSPQILYLGNFWKPFPDVILGVLLVLGAFACLFLPETLNRALPVTLQDGEEFGEDERIFEFASCCNKTTESTLELHTQEVKVYGGTENPRF